LRLTTPHTEPALATLVGRAANPMAVLDADGRVVVANHAFEALPDATAVLADPDAAGATVDPMPGMPGLCLLALDRRALPRPPAPREADLRRVLDTLATFVALTTPEGVVVDVNEAPLTALGLAREDVIGRRLEETADRLGGPAARDGIAAAMRAAGAGAPARLDVTIQPPGGGELVLDVQVVPVRDETGRIRHLVPSALDVTEQRRSEADLREREERFRATFDNAAVGLAHVAPDGRWIRVNDRLCAILGYSREQLMERTFVDVTHPDDAAVDVALARQVLEGSRASYTLEKRYLRGDGGVVWAELQVSLVRDAVGQPAYFVAAVRDVTRRREAEATARRQLAEIEALFRTSPLGLGVLDTDLRFVRINERLAEMNGLPVEAHIGRSVREVVPYLADTAEPILRRILETGEPAIGFEISGETFAEPGVPRTWLASWTPVRGRRDELVGISLVAEEVTERRKVERLRDTFIGMLSHELRTPITSLYAASQLLRRGIAADEATGRAPSTLDAELVEEVIAGTERLQRIVENLLVLARVERGVALPGEDPVLLQRVLPAVVASERGLWPDHHLELLPMPPNLPPVRSDADALAQVLRNLVSNAAKYGPPDGRIELSVEPCGEGAVCIAVSDDGPGLGAVDPDRLFDLYYRAEDASRRAAGAGIGLFVSRALVEAMGGTITAATRPDGVGAEFRVTLPVFEEA
jgi:PAS domain S-box-containing protein